MTKDASFKKVVRRHAEETGQRYTEALTDLEGLGARMHHEPVAERLLAHLRDRYGIDAGRGDEAQRAQDLRLPHRPQRRRARGSPARSRPLARGPASRATPRSCGSWSGRTIPAERLAVDDAVSDFDGSAVLVTRFVEGGQLPDGCREVRHDG